MKVIIIDDHQATSDSLYDSLIELKIFKKVSVFTDSQEAFENISKEFFDLYVIDINMPKIDGFSLAEKIQELRKRERIEIIFISGEFDLEGIKRAKIGENRHILIKPFGPKTFRQKICEVVEKLKEPAK